MIDGNVDPNGEFAADLRGGVNVTIDQLNIAPTNSQSGINPRYLRKQDGSIEVGYLGINGAAGNSLLVQFRKYDFEVGMVNYEPEINTNTESFALFKISRSDATPGSI